MEPLSFLGGAARPAAIFAIKLALTFVARITAPAIWLLSHATNLTVRLFGGDPRRDRQEVTEEEIRDLIATQSSYTEQQRQIIDGALEVADRTISLEDLIEELVGEIYDEHDRDILSVEHGSDGTLVVPGAFPIHDF